MKWMAQLFSKLFRRPTQTAWDKLDYGKPSTQGDEFRDRNQG